jgi:glycosyltransferase involved in cell wall biosynthesis
VKKRVIIFHPSLEDGGVEKNLYLISKYLKDKGVELEILTCNYNKKKRFKEGIKFIGTKSVFFQNKSRIIKYLICSIILFFNLFLKKNKPIIFAFQANIYAIIIAKILNTKVITRSNSAPSGWSNNILKKNIYKFFINLADDVVVNSIEFKKFFEREFNKKALFIYNPFDKNFINSKLKENYKIKFFKKNFLNIISIGRLTDQKDHLTLLKSIQLLDSKFKVRVIIAGKGKNYLSLKNFILEKKLQNKIKLLGYLKNPYHYIKYSDIVVLTSKFEGLPNILLEAQYLNKYIVSTNCPTGPKEILINGKAGDLINIGDYKSLYNLIMNYNLNKKKITKKINEGSKYFDRFDYGTNCKKYFNLIKKNMKCIKT